MSLRWKLVLLAAVPTVAITVLTITLIAGPFDLGLKTIGAVAGCGGHYVCGDPYQ